LDECRSPSCPSLAGPIYLTGGNVSGDAKQKAVARWRPWLTAVFAAFGATTHCFLYDALERSLDSLSQLSVLNHCRSAHPTTSKIGYRNLRFACPPLEKVLFLLQHFDCHNDLTLARHSTEAAGRR
jgi:hypothetical protein